MHVLFQNSRVTFVSLQYSKSDTYQFSCHTCSIVHISSIYILFLQVSRCELFLCQDYHFLCQVGQAIVSSYSLQWPWRSCAYILQMIKVLTQLTLRNRDYPTYPKCMCINRSKGFKSHTQFPEQREAPLVDRGFKQSPSHSLPILVACELLRSSRPTPFTTQRVFPAMSASI